MKVDTTEGGPWLGDGGLERAEIADAERAAGCLEELTVQRDNLPA